MKHPGQLTSVLIATAIMVFTSIIPVLNFINLVCCAGIILGGAAGTFYYAKQLEKTGQAVQNKDGLMIGLLSGIISAILYVILSTLILMVSKQNPVELLYKIVDEYGIAIPPESEKMLRDVYDEYARQGFSFMMIGIELFVRIISHTIFGPIGGLIAASVFNKRKNALKQ
ncbi:MAG: hypothetical protein L0Y79_10335 [Chlorobi bacterium]|nr:hypothetical protein [Chlorobiota bacterium]MCI0716307.1 hypothetical protein [Chlorobiota bacterium]